MFNLIFKTNMEEEIERKRIVCIVDDEQYIREIYAVKFLSEGYDVMTAKDGEEGLKMVRERKPDIILLDVQMPILDGFGFMEELQKDSNISSVPVIILSNIDDNDNMLKMGKFQTKFYVIKSLSTPQKVFNIVKEVLY
jgi:DNA-binding response OmpR family regulator